MISSIVRVYSSLPVALKVVAVLAAVVVLPLILIVLALLSPVLKMVAVLALGIAVIMVIIRLRQQASLRRWGILAASSLVALLAFSGISNAIYGGDQPERTQEESSAPAREETTVIPTEETTDTDSGAVAAAKEDEGGAREGDGDRERGRYDALATVTEVVDGDTIEIEPAIDGENEVRLIGVDTPETKDPDEGVEPYGPEASDYTSTELEGEEVELEFDAERKDQYDRLLAYVYPMGQEMFNEDLLETGHAQLYTVPPNDKYEGRFETVQEEARDLELGIWGLSHNQQCKLADRGNGIGEDTPGCVERAPEPVPEPTPSFRDRDCADFDSQAEAQEVLEDDLNDPNGLDADNDGQACETFSFGGNSASPSATSSASPSASPSASAGAGGGGGGGNRNGGNYAPAPPSAGGDIDCDQVDGPIPTPPGDPDNLDGDNDGWACE